MNLVLTYNRNPHHGSRSGYHQLVRHLWDRLHPATVHGRLPERLPERPLRWLARRSGMEWYDVWSLTLEAAAARRLVRGRGEVCHVLYGEDSYRFLGAVRPLAKPRGGRVMATFHQPPTVFDDVVRHTRGLRRLDAAVAVSREQASHLRAYVEPERVFFVPHGVDTRFFSPSERPPRGRAGRPTCLFVGSWLRDFESLADVVERLAESDVAVTVITNVDRARALERNPNVDARTGVSDAELLDAYRSADVLILPLLDCTANNSILEAMACGLPVVATAVGGVRDYVNDGCAVTVPPGDAAAMADAALALLSDPVRRAEMGSRARERALELDWNRVADRMTAVYAHVAGEDG